MPETPESLPATTAWRRTLTREHLDRTREASRLGNIALRRSVPNPTRAYTEWTSEEFEMLAAFKDEPIADQAAALGRSYMAVVEMRRKIGISKTRRRYERLKGIDE